MDLISNLPGRVAQGGRHLPGADPARCNDASAGAENDQQALALTLGLALLLLLLLPLLVVPAM
jgi:hypothetical protein